MRRHVLLTALVVLAVFVAFALWPLGDPRLAIRVDTEAARTKQAFLAEPAARRSELPNVILIVADDLGKHDVSVYRPASLPTPSLERLAREGVTFAAGYVTAPVCSPSRAALLTGRYQQRYGFDLLPHLRGERSSPPHGALFWRAGGHRGIRTGEWKLISDTRTGTRVLFDLGQDPAETTDRSGSRPEVVEDLEARLRAWEATLAPPLWPNVMEYRFQENGRDFVFPL